MNHVRVDIRIEIGAGMIGQFYQSKGIKTIRFLLNATTRAGLRQEITYDKIAVETKLGKSQIGCSSG